jgi:hypothetical protein
MLPDNRIRNSTAFASSLTFCPPRTHRADETLCDLAVVENDGITSVVPIRGQRPCREDLRRARPASRRRLARSS